MIVNLKQRMVRKILIFVSRISPETILVTTALRFPECGMCGSLHHKIGIKLEFNILNN
jgi:hypothetical protein